MGEGQHYFGNALHDGAAGEVGNREEKVRPQ